MFRVLGFRYKMMILPVVAILGLGVVFGAGALERALAERRPA